MMMIFEDVIYFFFIFDFCVKQDVFFGCYMIVWFEVMKLGEYWMFCVEYCGFEYLLMGGIVIVLEWDEYEVWFQFDDIGIFFVFFGEQFFILFFCLICYQVGIEFWGFFFYGLFGIDVQIVMVGDVMVDEEYICEFILDFCVKV